MCFCLKEIAVFLFKLGWLGYDVCPRISLPRKRGRSWPGGWGVRHWERGTAQGEAVRAQACGLQSRMSRNSCAEAGREPKIFIYGIYFYQEKKKKNQHHYGAKMRVTCGTYQNWILSVANELNEQFANLLVHTKLTLIYFFQIL